MNRGLGFLLIIINFSLLLNGADDGSRFPKITSSSLGREAAEIFPVRSSSLILETETPEAKIKEQIDEMVAFLAKFLVAAGKTRFSLQEYDYVPRTQQGAERIKFLQDVVGSLKKAHRLAHETSTQIGECAGRVEMKVADEQLLLKASTQHPPRPDLIYAERNGSQVNSFLQPLLHRFKFTDNEDLKWLLFYFTILLDTAKKGFTVSGRVEGWQTQLEDSTADVQRLIENFVELKQRASDLYKTVLSNQVANEKSKSLSSTNAGQ